MTTTSINMPPYTVARKRKNGHAWYFVVPEHLRPAVWLPSIPLGNDSRKPLQAIHDEAKALYERLLRERRDEQLGETRSEKPGSVPDVIARYKESEYWTSLRDVTKKAYEPFLTLLEKWARTAGNPHIGQFQVKHLYAALQKKADAPRQQKFFKSVMSVVWAHAVRLGHINSNIVEEVRLLRRTKKSSYKIVPWSDTDVLTFIAKADEMGWSGMGTAVMIGYDAGQRQTDVLQLQQPRDYKDGCFIYDQSKTGKRVAIPVTSRLRARLDKIPREQMVLVVDDKTKKPFTKDAFCHRFREIADAAGLKEHIFKQLRHAHLQELERAGCDEHERNSHSGHSRATGNALMDKAYGLDRDHVAATNATAKLEEYRRRKLNASLISS